MKHHKNEKFIAMSEDKSIRARQMSEKQKCMVMMASASKSNLFRLRRCRFV